MQPMSDEHENQLLVRLKRDDRSALHEVFDTNYGMACRAIHRFIKDQSTCEDLAQEVFIRFWEKRHQITVNSSLSAYLKRMAVNEALGYHRRKKRHPEEELTDNLRAETVASGEQEYLHSELQANINHAIDGLPSKCRTVFQLSRYEGLSYREIAHQMDISVKTVENQMSKALRVLRSSLQQYLHLFL